jgi:predicted MFS family arabinose efflux permease
LASIAGRAFGPPPVDRLVRTSAFSSAADAFVAVSLAGSLFFNVSIDAARPRIILYLIVTMAPFAIVAPLIGPFVDRVRGGHRWVIALACLGRAALCLSLAFQLRSLLLYPLAFSILVLNKTHQVAKSALIPRLVDERERLVAANSTHTRVTTAAGATGGAVAVTVLGLGSASAVLFVGACSYAMALLMALRIPRPPRVRPSPTLLVIEAQELRSPSLLLGVSSMALIRGAVGFFTFFAAFTLKASGEPTWVFGAVAVAGGLGGFAATFVAPGLRRLLLEERILEVALVVPAVVALFIPKAFVAPSLVAVAFTLGLAATVGRQGFDSLVQRDAPDAERGRAFARFEARLQLTWVAGALLPVLVRASNAVGLYFLGGVLIVGALTYGTGARAAVRRHWGQWSSVLPTSDRATEESTVPLSEQLLATAQWLADRGSKRQAVAVCAAALDALRRGSGEHSPELTDAFLALEGRLDTAARLDREFTDDDVEAALQATEDVVRSAGEFSAG